MDRRFGMITQSVGHVGDGADSLRERVYRHLEESLCAGRIRDGEPLDQDALCERLGVSRTPLRDALIRLEAEGFVTIEPRRGVFITPLTDAFVKSACQIIGTLESESLQSSFHKLTARMVRELEESVARQETLLPDRLPEYRSENDRFHDMLFRISGNPLLQELASRLRRRLNMMPEHPLSREQAHAAMTDHQRIVESLKMGNCVAAASILRFERWSPLRFLYSGPVGNRRRAAPRAAGKTLPDRFSAA